MIKNSYIAASLIMLASSRVYAQEVADTLGSTYDQLDELVVEARKEVVKSDGAKLTYDLEQDDSSKGQSLLDALRKIPMVTVDGQDNVYIRGDKNFRIYVNGKEDPMLTANASKVLKAMPAESVSKIEVITEPGARYDAEGTGGILNLITERKQRKDGYTGSVSASFSSHDSGFSLYGRMKQDKITADASINLVDNSIQKQTQYQRQETFDYASEEAARRYDDVYQNLTFKYLGANLNMSWEPTDKDLMTIGANINDIDARIAHLDIVGNVFNRQEILTQSVSQKIKGKLMNLGATGNASYRRLFSDKGHSLTMAYRFNYGKNPMEMHYENSADFGSSSLPPLQSSINDTYQREHTATIDYVNPLNDGKHTIEAGAKGIFRRNTAITGQWGGATSADLNEEVYGKTYQIQDVYALYASYSGHFHKVALSGGLRYEHTYMGLDFPDGSSENFRSSLNDIVPNAAVTYMFGPANNLRLAYQMRISRPSISQLNPTPFKLGEIYGQVGNPDLESERYNGVSLTYSNYGRAIGGNVSLNYRQANNSIENYLFFDQGTWFQSYRNFGKNRQCELSGFLNWNISRQISMSVNGSINYTDIRSRSENLSNQGWNGSYGANFNYTGPWKVKYSAYGGQSTGSIQLQGSWSGWYYYGIGISKNLLKDESLTLALNASNFLTKFTHWKSESHTSDQSINTYSKNRSWNVGISVSWKFGHLQEQVKKTSANLDNDDTKSGGDKKGGIM